MTTIRFVRHGITEWNERGVIQGRSNIPLNERGKQQAQALGERLTQEENWDIIISSDMMRAEETANIISANLGLNNVILDERIREIDCGQLEGTNEEMRVNKWGSDWRNLDLGMESFENVADRGSDFLTDISERYKGKRILIVSHGAIIGLTLRKFLPNAIPKDNLNNTSITIIRQIEEEWECTLFNCTKHLEAGDDGK
ncbi:histidine phosphatase family protein [Bacillus sp. AGMB 02131]|uniref:Histidine phosphatase family protein n=1 Tax=Peribacillus faecalis TaxID=2772559 RepID=A0A927HC41_9BACI|nr:histidine phosphatase family protein [Peribacillus faecalis]MBD3109176.1 histidine phosphatase family protein [Peribacillus faecalis]